MQFTNPPLVILSSGRAHPSASEMNARYSEHHGFGFAQVMEPVESSIERAACATILQQLQTHNAVMWLAEFHVVTNPGPMPDFYGGPEVEMIVPIAASPLDPRESRLNNSHFLDDSCVIFRSTLTINFFEMLLSMPGWNNSSGCVVKLLSELFKRMPQFRGLLSWCWQPEPKSFRRAVSSPRNLESETQPAAWRPGDFVACLSKSASLIASQIEFLRSAIDGHGIDWTARGLANRLGPMATDRRHIGWMRALLLTRKWITSLEVGCWRGASAVAFVDAVNQNAIRHAHFCDRRFQPEFLEVIAQCKGAYSLHQERSIEALARFEKGELDFVYVDGNHSLPTLKREYLELSRLKPLVVAAHDVNGAGGPAYLFVQLQRDGYFCLCDFKCRPGEGTHRGFLIACREYDDYLLALDCYRRHIW